MYNLNNKEKSKVVHSFTIGEKARQIDQKKISDRMKIRKKK